MCDIDLEPVEFWRSATPRARKPRACEVCDWPIRIGDVYVRDACMQDGRFVDEWMCLACAHWRDVFGEHHDFYPFSYSLESVLHECVVDNGAMFANGRFARSFKEWSLMLELKEQSRDWRNALASIAWRRRATKQTASRLKLPC